MGRIGEPAAERARRLDLAAVNDWFSSPAAGWLPEVFLDHAACGRIAADHLLGRGFRNLATLAQTHDRGADVQAAAMKARAEERGFGEGWLGTKVVDDPITYANWREGIETIEDWMDAWNVPVGLLVRDPAWARVVIDRAGERGWHVPQEIAIVCSFNDELHCEHPEPGLTAVEQPDEQTGYEAAGMLDRLIDLKRQGGSPYADPQTVILPPVGIVARFSTDFFAVADPLVVQSLQYISAHLHRPFEVASVAQAVGVARRTLDGWFRQSLGVTVAEEIIRLRIERVKRELMGGDDTIETIARHTGFASTRTLNEQFKQRTGMSPTAFREGLPVSWSRRGKPAEPGWRSVDSVE